MFEARLEQGHLLKKIIEAIKDLVKTVNIDANSSGLSMQAMDQSHVALVSFKLQESGFSSYRCDRPQTLGLSIEHLSKILKCAGNDDIITLQAEEDPTTLKFIFESNKQDKISEFNLNLLQLDAESLGIPETEYSSIVTMPSPEFTRICKELSTLAETGIQILFYLLKTICEVNIETTKEYVKFSINGENGSGSILLKAQDAQRKEDSTIIEVDEPVSLSFAIRYLNLFNKASTLSPQVVLSLSGETPLVVEYKIEKLGSLKFYLAPKINDDEQQN